MSTGHALTAPKCSLDMKTQCSLRIENILSQWMKRYYYGFHFKGYQSLKFINISSVVIDFNYYAYFTHKRCHLTSVSYFLNFFFSTVKSRSYRKNKWPYNRKYCTILSYSLVDKAQKYYCVVFILT